MISNTLFCNVQSYITRWLVIHWNLKFKWVFIQIYSSWIIPQKNNFVLKKYDLDDVPLVSKDNLAEEATKKWSWPSWSSFWLRIALSLFVCESWVKLIIVMKNFEKWSTQKYARILVLWLSDAIFKRLQDISIYVCLFADLKTSLVSLTYNS